MFWFLAGNLACLNSQREWVRNSRIWEEVRQKEKRALAEDHCVEGTVALHHQQDIWLVQNSYNKTKLQLLCSLKSWCGNAAVAHYHMNYCFGFRGPMVTQLLSCWAVTSSEIAGNCSPVIWLICNMRIGREFRVGRYWELCFVIIAWRHLAIIANSTCLHLLLYVYVRSFVRQRYTTNLNTFLHSQWLLTAMHCNSLSNILLF